MGFTHHGRGGGDGFAGPRWAMARPTIGDRVPGIGWIWSRNLWWTLVLVGVYQAVAEQSLSKEELKLDEGRLEVTADSPSLNASQAEPARRRAKVVTGCGLLALFTVLFYGVVASWTVVREGANSERLTSMLFAAMIAGGICWISSTLALLVTVLSSPRSASEQGNASALTGVLGGMLFRMGLPLVAGLILQNQAPSLSAAGVFGYIVAFYLWTLVTETALSLWLLKMNSPRLPQVSTSSLMGLPKVS